VREHRVQTQAGDVLQWRLTWWHNIAKVSLLGKLLLVMMMMVVVVVVVVMMMMIVINTTESEGRRRRPLHRVLQRELDVLKLLQAEPLAVHRHPKIAQVYRVLGTSHVFLQHDPAVMYTTVIARWTQFQAGQGFLPHRRRFLYCRCLARFPGW